MSGNDVAAGQMINGQGVDDNIHLVRSLVSMSEVELGPWLSVSIANGLMDGMG
ncbi:hypothetical protein D082_21640 [Synechocystis sp. PCC 6714]|nr:hypothetical protein D082_21640 [Synechocystis sp. PCC 6714]